MPVSEQHDDPLQLERRARHAEALFEGIDDAVFVHDLKGRILDANPAACRRLGYTRAELLQLNTRDIDAPEFARDFEKRVAEQLSKGRLECTGWHVASDGRRIPVDINSSMVTFDGQSLVISVMRDISHRLQAERRLESQYEVTRALAETTTLEAAAPRILAALCTCMDWAFGTLWIVDRREQALRCVETWQQPDAGFGELALTTRQALIAAGQGVPGKVLAGSGPLWYADVSAIDSLRARLAVRLGLHGACAFPIRSGQEVLGVIDFFSKSVSEPDAELLSMLAALGSQIGQFVERVRVEEALRNSQAFYHSLVESLPQNVFRKDRLGRITFGNQRYAATLGMPIEELIGKTDFDLFPKELATKYVRDDHVVMETGKTFEAIEEHRLPSGELLYVQVMKTPVSNAQGEVIGTQGIFWDVTTRKKNEDEIKKINTFLDSIIENIPIVLFVKDAVHLRFERVNRLAEEVLGLRRGELIGKRPEDFFRPDEVALFSQQDREVLERRELVEVPVEEVVTAMGRRMFRTKKIPILDERGAPKYLLGISEDITERQRMRAMLTQSEKLASIGLLSAGLAHEINNPLAYVGNNLVVLERDMSGLRELINLYEQVRPRLAELDAEVARQVEEIAERIDLAYIRDNLERILSRTRQGVERMAKIVQGLRSLARTDRPQLEEVSLPELIDSSLEMVRGRLRKRDIQLEQRYENVPRVRCVPTQIGQVLLNLLINASQAIESRPGNKGIITITLKPVKTDVMLEVSDNGVGIDPEELSRIFDPFYTSKPVGEGTGLGLTISHGIITGHGGRFEVESQVGQGSQFRIFLPLEAGAGRNNG
ncbi:MAG: PAS domain S-box protein [Gemmataceae bacterium]